ncbi:E3 ubiquitin-protein ligase HIP1 [Pyrus ussuriensis x Pyrus communis]|uniref:E3 ubiquitin-protein ligase HIP1 n=1 Tax=Pyrus ussuriensis x Pyrus communis TaxID=2448454 RepID=A0A5N5GS24_9ROSA|nr:E3 ubiquitin-protein ligase HIP1 [Pyrus ussuriensis x Pyrus communis]
MVYPQHYMPYGAAPHHPHHNLYQQQSQAVAYQQQQQPPKQQQRHRALHLYRDGLLHVDDLSPLVRDWDAEILTSQPATAYSSTNLGSQIERLHLLQEANKKPPGLSQEVLDCLSTDIFSSAEVGVDGLLICLPCEHRFHAACLSPWALIRGDCPYCRRVIVVDGQNAKMTT